VVHAGAAGQPVAAAAAAAVPRCERPGCARDLRTVRHRPCTHAQREYSICNSCDRAIRRGMAWDALLGALPRTKVPSIEALRI
jgi:hypothetical protein